jgi:pyridoxal phosphate enzyme (YggS family)
MTIELNRQECLFHQSLAEIYPIRLLRLMTIIKPFYQGKRSGAKSFFGLLQEPLLSTFILLRKGDKAMTDIEANCEHIRERIPDHVLLVAAAKTRTIEEVAAAVRAGITVMGHNYLQEAEKMVGAFGNEVKWHMLGHLQKNKVKKAVQVFDMIETVDSWALAELLDRHCAALDKSMPILVEINSGREPNKTGVFPEKVDHFVRGLADLPHIRVQGLMTMGPRFGDPENARPYFRETKTAFDRLAAAGIPKIEMRFLSMGMSNSYEVAIEEGSNMVRIGTKLFGPRAPGNA